MANPQTEDGFTRIANELLDEIILFPFKASEYKIVLWVVRHTFGYNKLWTAEPSFRPLARELNVSHSNLIDCFRTLTEKGVLIQIDGQIRLQKDYEKWLEMVPQSGRCADQVVAAPTTLLVAPATTPVAPATTSGRSSDQFDLDINRSHKDKKDRERQDGEVPNSNVKPSASMLRNMWNKLAPANLPRIKYMTPSREKKCRDRLKEHPDYEFWREIMVDKIPNSLFLTGRGPVRENGKPWSMTFDWLMENDKNCVKISEGNYDDDTHQRRKAV